MRTAKTLSITLPPELLNKAQEFASREHRTMSELVREALRRYIDEGRSAELESLREMMHYGQTMAHEMGVHTGGFPFGFIAAAYEGVFVPVTSPTLLDEFDEILLRKFRWVSARREALLLTVQRRFDVVSTTDSITHVKADPDEDRVPECALAGRADSIVIGDKHLLKLGSYQGVRILILRQFMDILNPTA